MASWIVLIVVWGLYEPGESAYFLYLLLAAIGTNLLLNVLNIVFFSRYVWSDSKFQQCLLRLRKTCFGRVMIYMCCTVAVILSHKHICLLFSNLFGSKFFKYKVSSLSKLTPLNVVRYCSLVPSILALAAGGVLNYGVQSLGTASVVFIQSIDSIVVTLLALVFAVWVTIRQPNDYENDTQEMETADDNFANS